MLAVGAPSRRRVSDKGDFFTSNTEGRLNDAIRRIKQTHGKTLAIDVPVDPVVAPLAVHEGDGRPVLRRVDPHSARSRNTRR